MTAKRVEPSRLDERLLRNLSASPDYVYRMAMALGSPISSVRTAFKKLEAEGYIRVARRTQNGRAVRMGRLSKKGWQWLESIDEYRKFNR